MCKVERDLLVLVRCPFCGKSHEVAVNFRDYQKYCGGGLISTTMSYLTLTEREQLISGLCPECQDKFFSVDFEDEPWDGEGLEEEDEEDYL